MMELIVTPEQVRLDGRHLDALMRGLGSPSGPAPEDLDGEIPAVLDAAWRELVTAGLVEESGAVARAYLDLLRPMAQPWMMMEASAAGPAGSEGHWLWLDGGGAVAAADVGNGWYDLLATSPQGSPNAIARLLALGARDSLLSGEIEIPMTAMDRFAEAADARSPDALAAVFQDWGPIAKHIQAGDWRLVHVGTQWASLFFESDALAADATQQVMVLDTPAGYASLIPQGDGVLVSGLSATDMWAILVELTLPPSTVDPERLVSLFERGD